jgi:hypothetical protein
MVLGTQSSWVLTWKLKRAAEAHDKTATLSGVASSAWLGAEVKYGKQSTPGVRKL